jgi:coproporphyrinogen III oxidase-like Fe-S oxidoreductase
MAACPRPAADGEELDGTLAAAERLLLGLRAADGVVADDRFELALKTLEVAGLVERRDGRVAPTRRGLDLHNQVAVELLAAARPSRAVVVSPRAPTLPSP